MGIAVAAYSPLGNPGFVSQGKSRLAESGSDIKLIAENHGVTAN